MKISTSFNYKRSTYSLIMMAVAAGSLLFNSCKKDDTTAAVISGLSIINASPTPSTYNVYLNTDTKVNTAALPFGGTRSYVNIPTGSNTLKFTSASSIESILTKTIVSTENVAYSYYLIGNTAANLDGLLITDDLSVPSGEKAYVRFINVSPDAPALDLAVTAATANTISDKSYKAASAFVQLDPKTYSFDIKDKATGVVKTTLTGIVLAAGGHYTIIAKGMNNPTGLEIGFGGQVITNQ